MPLSPGERLGPYQILSQIGAGGMGEVFRATDTRLHRTVAIKVLAHAKFADPNRKVELWLSQRLFRTSPLVDGPSPSVSVSRPSLAPAIQSTKVDFTPALKENRLQGSGAHGRHADSRLAADW